MKKIFLLITLPFMFFITLSAQITQEHADLIILGHLPNDTSAYTLYAKDTVQPNYVVLTAANEKLKLNYPCWVYYVSFTGETESKYLIVKESNGNVLEVNAKNDEGPEDLEDWRGVPFLQYSLWECTGKYYSFDYFIEMKVFPSMSKLIIRTVPTVLPGLHTMHGTYPYALDYMIIDNIMYYLSDTGQFFAMWTINYISQNEIILVCFESGFNPPVFAIKSYHFICQTEFCEI